MAFIDIQSVSKSFGSVAVLRDVDLQIEEGAFVVFVGPSGCGKSTLLRVISGLEDVTTGTVAIAGQVVNDVEPAARGVAMVFQSYALYPHMTVFQNVSFSLRMANKAKDFIAGKVRDAAAILRLDSLLDRRPGQLSGGQKQRVAIGRAIVREPQVFLFDEPLSNLDAELRVQMRGEIMNLHRRLGTTMIYVTHDQVEAMTLADKMVVLSAGEVQQAGKPLDLYDDPDNRFVASFVGSPKMNFLPARVVGSDDVSVTLAVPGRAEPLSLPFSGYDRSITTVEIGIRPQHLAMLADARAAAEAGPVLEGTIALVEELGDVSYVHLTLADGTPVVVRGGRSAKTAANPCRFAADLSHALLFDGGGKRLRSGKGQAG